jgi:hypothetical protein
MSTLSDQIAKQAEAKVKKTTAKKKTTKKVDES